MIRGWLDEDAAPHDAVDQMYRGELDGVVLRGLAPTAMREATVAAALKRTDWTDLYADPAAPKSLGVMLAPTMLHQRGPASEDYFATTERDTAWLRDQCGGLFDDLESRLSRLAGGRPAKVLDRPRGHRPATLRVMHEGYGAMPHIDSYPRLPAFENLFQHTDRALQFSWYVLLQAPEDGGLLQVALDADEPPATTVPLMAGDGVCFAGSRVRHQVTNAAGGTPRVTLGGFAGLDSERRTLYYWS